MIKKLLIPVVVILMLLSLTACSESNESKDSTTTISQSEETTTPTETELATTTEVTTQATATPTPKPTATSVPEPTDPPETPTPIPEPEPTEPEPTEDPKLAEYEAGMAHVQALGYTLVHSDASSYAFSFTNATGTFHGAVYPSGDRMGCWILEQKPVDPDDRGYRCDGYDLDLISMLDEIDPSYMNY